MFCILSLLSSLLLNVSFTVIVIVHRALREQKELIICLVLTVSNICYSVLFSTFFLASVFKGEWPIGKTFCSVVGTVHFFLALLRFPFMLAFTVDRFCGIFYPFRFPHHRSKVAAVIFTVGGMHSVISPVLFNFNSIGCYIYEHFLCIPRVNCSNALCYNFIVLQVLMIISSGILAPLILNIVMFYKANKLRSTVAFGTIANVDSTCTDSTCTDCTGTTEASHDIRGMVTIALLLTSVVGLTSPLASIVAARSMNMLPAATIGSPIITLLEALFGDLFILVPTADALVVWRNKDVKACVMSLWRRACNTFKTVH